MSNILSQNVLILNQNFEPLTVCSVKRAILLTFLGKVEVIENMDGLRIRTVTTSFSIPSVVRLWHYARLPRKQVMLTRKNIIKRDGGRCMYCGRRDGPMTVDHILPRRMGGDDSWENLITACLRCNNAKGDRTPEQAQMKLLSKPKKPNHIMFIQRFVGVPDRRWRPYLFLEEAN